MPDPRVRRGRRFALATLVAVGVCAMTCAGHNSRVAIAEWARRCEQEVLARLGCPYDPFAGCYRVPGERTLRDAFARVDPGGRVRPPGQAAAAAPRPERPGRNPRARTTPHPPRDDPRSHPRCQRKL
ncbi:transposase family protein [Streptomyces atratus]|uniref:transposase family protein n=1 Tax=Streptomyces atratus TaxID=1893 RepID=UPI003B833754